MQITIHGKGGLAGNNVTYELDTTQLDASDAEELEVMLEDVHFFDDASPPASENIGADMMQWEITAIEDGLPHSVRFADDGSPRLQPWKAIVEKVRTLH
jgi:hypothetical protein